MSLPMDPFEGVKIEVISEGHTLDLFDDPEATETEESVDSYFRSSYVQAITGAKFAVRVILGATFQLYDVNKNYHVRIRVKYDSRKIWKYDTLSKGYVEAKRRNKVEVSRTFDTTDEYCPISREWKKGNTTFSALAIDEETDVTALVPHDINHLGSFQIHIDRVMEIPRREPKLFPAGDYMPITSVSEKMVKVGEKFAR